MYVLDASALLAVMLGETGTDVIHAILANATMGAVNLSEVVAKLQERDVPDGVIDQSLADLALALVPFDRDQAMRAGKLRQSPRGARLSLGDRACLALAASIEATAITTDRAWARVDTGISVEVAR